MPIHKSTHPSVLSKISQLRSKIDSEQVAKLAGETASLLGAQAGQLVFDTKSLDSNTQLSVSNEEYSPTIATPSEYVIVPVLRSGLSMVSSFASTLPNSKCPVYHLGLYREKTTLSPVEYYNKLPVLENNVDIAFVLDPVVATGGTAHAVIQTLQEWGARKIVFVCLLSSKLGLERVAKNFPDVELIVGEVDDNLTQDGYIQPGIGDIGDRLFSTC